MSHEMLTLTNCNYMLMIVTDTCSLLIFLLSMAHDNEYQQETQKHKSQIVGV